MSHTLVVGDDNGAPNGVRGGALHALHLDPIPVNI